jgi:hypothetical protein
VWLGRLIQFHFDTAHGAMRDWVERLINAIQQLLSFLDDAAGGNSVRSRLQVEGRRPANLDPRPVQRRWRSSPT